MEQYIYFWGMHSPFSNWHPSKFTIDGTEYTCSEQYYMRQKALCFGDKKSASAIMATSSPGVMKRIGICVKGFDQSKWDMVKGGVMAKALYAKVCSTCTLVFYHVLSFFILVSQFTQNADLRQDLLGTRGKTLVEASPYDRVWGIGLWKSDPRARQRSTWLGLNLLGELLTKLRETL